MVLPGFLFSVTVFAQTVDLSGSWTFSADGYRRQEVRLFVKTAFEQHKKDLLEAVNRINQEIDKKIQEEIKR